MCLDLCVINFAVFKHYPLTTVNDFLFIAMVTKHFFLVLLQIIHEIKLCSKTTYFCGRFH